MSATRATSTVHRIEIGIRPRRDPRGEKAARTVRSFLGIHVERVRTRDVYKISVASKGEMAHIDIDWARSKRVSVLQYAAQVGLRHGTR